MRGLQRIPARCGIRAELIVESAGRVCGINKGEKTKNCYTYYLNADGFYEMTGDGKLHARSVFQ